MNKTTLSLTLSFFSLVSFSLGVSSAYSDDTMKITVFQSFENASYCLRLEPNGTAEYLIWSNARVRERYAGVLQKKVRKELIEKISTLPALAHQRTGKPLNQEDTEIVFEPDRFSIYKNPVMKKGSLRNAPQEYSHLIGFAKNIGKSLNKVSVNGLYIMAYSLVKKAYDPFPLNKESLKKMPALNKALSYPFCPIIIEDKEERSLFPLCQDDVTCSVLFSPHNKSYFIQYLDGGSFSLLEMMN